MTKKLLRRLIQKATSRNTSPKRQEPADGSLRPCAEVYEPTTGRVMTCLTTEPAVQLYTGNFLEGAFSGDDGTAYQQHTGFCLETQRYPNAVNVPQFPNTILRPGETYRQATEYRFSTR